MFLVCAYAENVTLVYLYIFSPILFDLKELLSTAPDSFIKEIMINVIIENEENGEKVYLHSRHVRNADNEKHYFGKSSIRSIWCVVQEEIYLFIPG